MTVRQKTRVLIVNDSATVRAALRRALSSDDTDIVVIGEAVDGLSAVTAAAELRPDAILMDVVMPHMDGYAATRAVMAATPTPIVLYSGVVSTRDVAVAMEALRSGALHIAEALPSPSSEGYEARRAALAQLLRSMANVSVTTRKRLPTAIAARFERTPQTEVFGIASSTGGPQALDTILRRLPYGTMPPILVVQHIAAGFTDGLATWLSTVTLQRVVVARDGAPAERGVVYLAPERKQLGVDVALRLTVRDDPPVGVFQPSGTYLFRSLARWFGARAAGVVLTGMGADGAAGLADLRAAGGATVVQDAETSVIFGMPQAAVEAGGATEMLAIEHIAQWLMQRSTP